MGEKEEEHNGTSTAHGYITKGLEKWRETENVHATDHK